MSAGPELNTQREGECDMKTAVSISLFKTCLHAALMLQSSSAELYNGLVETLHGCHMPCLIFYTYLVLLMPPGAYTFLFRSCRHPWKREQERGLLKLLGPCKPCTHVQ